MKFLFLALLLSTSAFATDFSCTASIDGKEIRSQKVEVMEDITEVSLGIYKEVELIGSAIQGQVSAFMIFDGVMFGSISMNAASYNMFMIGEGELNLSCALIDSSLPLSLSQLSHPEI